MAKRGEIRIGTSGWHYDHWTERFYPKEIKANDRLAFYAGHFNAVEINNTFYNLPSAKTIREWRETVPKGFLFAAKASRYITHMKKLKDPREATERFFHRIGELKSTLGPVLFQLPPQWHRNVERLQTMLSDLPKGRYAFEFRDDSWFDDEVNAVLRKHKAAFCVYDLAGEQSPKTVTTNWVYVRLHGPGDPYEGSYDDAELKEWASAITEWSSSGKDVFCFFDNDQAAYAVQNALKLKELVS